MITSSEKSETAIKPLANEQIAVAGDNIFCDECGTELSGNNKFCQNCGCPLKAERSFTRIIIIATITIILIGLTTFYVYSYVKNKTVPAKSDAADAGTTKLESAHVEQVNNNELYSNESATIYKINDKRYLVRPGTKIASTTDIARFTVSRYLGELLVLNDKGNYITRVV